ncbi:hypothetical protein B0H15DRAFT_939956 [Mycena belliarum]|uniref:RPA43 OB domain-containing protein n=1 Tax=Mycena belliarum TaxID=1033014 RepID=A0AAD6XM73_9AGAR|nr:hypothetical protein B0H15DRAFT_939956 [Mycena belliae]
MSTSKKRKTADPALQPKKKPKLVDKGKQKALGDGEFQVVQAALVVSVPPMFASSPSTGVRELLDSMIMRYIPALRGVVLAHSNLSFLKPTAAITADCPFLVCNIQFDATVWSPRVRMRLAGKINLCSPDHISLLLHKTFNVSIPRHHIPTDEWEFEPAPAEAELPEDTDEDDDAPAKEAGERTGAWVHKLTGTTLGGENGYLEFVVIGLTVANEMLSVVGSIQHDPFSPEHVAVQPKPKPKAEANPTAAVGETEDESDDSENE